MTGLRRRVAIGFLSIVCLLFFSGMISLFELSHLSRDTGDILKANKRNIELAKRMLDAAHEQNVALIHLAVFGDRSYDSVCRNRMESLENTLAVAQSEALDKSFLDSLAFATTEMRLLTDNFLASGDGTPFRTAFAPLVQADSAALASRWYQSDYETLYGRLTSAIKSYMTSTQSSLVPRAEQMKKRLSCGNARADFACGDDCHRADALLFHVGLLRQSDRSDEQESRRLPRVPHSVRCQSRIQGRGAGAQREDRSPHRAGQTIR